MENTSAILPGLNFRRIAAFFVDHFILSFLSMIPFLLLFNFIVKDMNYLFLLFPITLILGVSLYLLKDCYGGRSLGKRLYGLTVKTFTDQQKPGLKSLIVRNLFTFIWPLELLVLVFSKDQRRLGDKIANTAVFYSGKKLGWRAKVFIPILAVFFFIGFIFFITIFAIKNDDSYKTSVRFIKTSPDVRSQVGDIVEVGFFPMGGMSVTNGRGAADYDIKVKGSVKTVHVNIQLIKEPNKEWIVKDYNFAVYGGKK